MNNGTNNSHRLTILSQVGQLKEALIKSPETQEFDGVC